MNSTPIEVIPPGVKIPVNIPTELHVRIQQLLLEGLPFKDFPHFMTCIREVKDNSLKDPLSYHLQTLVYLCDLIEESAKINKLTVTKEFDLESSKVSG